MPGEALDTYLAGVDPRARRVVRELDRAICAAHSDFDVAIKYRILMYTIGQNWRRWVCAINATAKRVSLNFLYGVLLDDPRHVLRGGTSVLMSWDLAFDDEVDAAGVGAYVAEAVRRYDEYASNEDEILAKSRVAAKASRQRRG